MFSMDGGGRAKVERRVTQERKVGGALRTVLNGKKGSLEWAKSLQDCIVVRSLQYGGIVKSLQDGIAVRGLQDCIVVRGLKDCIVVRGLQDSIVERTLKTV